MIREAVDGLIDVVDSGLRSLTGVNTASGQPTNYPAPQELTEEQRRKVASLMRINHCGEVCAQALYESQALVADSLDTKQTLKQAANEEKTHLALCRARLRELDSKPSIFEPFFFVASVGLGLVAGRFGDKVSMGFVEATEDEVCKHLDHHLDEIGDQDERTTAMLRRIRADEAKHQSTALDSGGLTFAKPIKTIMGLSARVMTKLTAIV